MERLVDYPSSPEDADEVGAAKKHKIPQSDVKERTPKRKKGAAEGLGLESDEGGGEDSGTVKKKKGADEGLDLESDEGGGEDSDSDSDAGENIFSRKSIGRKLRNIACNYDLVMRILDDIDEEVEDVVALLSHKPDVLVLEKGSGDQLVAEMQELQRPFGPLSWE